ncbi:MAG TPA: ADP-glyceromanno-heptose 6-epimerase [Candidatus Andersenbacteria bacterium]|nr:ADP-glyceromanno-heptose 6-epimerase [Candidatus Andersenbacteria bacterium]
MIIVTGGAGFIGSATVAALNERGRDDIIIVDDVDHDEKEHNISNLQYDQIIGITEFREQLLSGEFDHQDIEAIIHMGACSSTTETNWEYLMDNNVEYSKDIIRWCQSHNVRCIYASSAATYGNGEHGYNDDEKLFDQLEPLNLYGKSKLLVDIWSRDGGFLQQAVGLRFFNVFGPNEWHKESMMSVIAKKYPDMAAGKGITLFKSYEKKYKDGEQKRDFIYIQDAVRAVLFFLDNKSLAGIYNVGTGIARSWLDVAKAMFASSDIPEKIVFIEMPDDVKNQYQYFTQADMAKLENTGFDISENYTLKDGIGEYIQDYLAPHRHIRKTVL